MQVLPLELGKWEDGARDALVLSVFEDERPLRGAAGLVDWRLCGRLSRMMRAGRATGAAGEQLLFPATRRLRFQRILWFGLGSRAGYDLSRLSRDLRWMKQVIADAGVQDWTLQLPGRALGLVPAREAANLLVALEDSATPAATIIEDVAGLREIGDRGPRPRRNSAA